MLTIGIDEVGRGSLAGPLVIGVVVLEHNIEGLKDSKLLTSNKRRCLNQLIKASSKYCSTGWVWPKEIDRLGLSKATKLAIERAIQPINTYVYKILIDGNYNFLKDQRVETIIKGDQTVPEISAASIIAKVSRDNFMNNLNSSISGYGFDTNVGYGTKQHLEAIKSKGASSLHRRSFIRNNSF